MKKLPINLINDVVKQYKTGQLDPHQLIKQSLTKLNKHKELNAFISCTSELAIAKSIESSHRYKNGKPLSNLDGIPIAIKDNFCVKDVTTTTCGSKMLLNFIPTYNATVYEKLERLGAILIGKTNLDEFGMGSGTIDSYFGPTKNIWSKSLTDDNWNIVGGSSGGSAVSVAAGITYAALGSDTGGSTRNPASYCGVIGLKPTYGLLSRHGLIPLVNSMDVPGILTQSIDDCTIILNALAGPDPLDSTTIKSQFNEIEIPCIEDISIENIKIGIPKEYHCEGLSQEMLDTWIKVADLLENGGAQLKSISLPHTFASIYIYSILNPCEVASNMARYDGIQYGHRSDENYSTEQLYAKTRAEGFNNVVKNRILTGNFFLLRKNYDKYFQTALKIRRLILNDFNMAFGTNRETTGTSDSTAVNVILTPTTLTDAPFYKDFIQNNNRDQCAIQDYCTQAANMAGIPAITIPIRLSSNGLPLSLQLMGPNLSEKRLLTIGKWIEHQVKFIPMWNVKE